MKIKDIPKGKCMVMSYPNIERMMCGVYYAQQHRDGTIDIIYDDGSKESRVADFRIQDKSIFQVVSFVQELRQGG